MQFFNDIMTRSQLAVRSVVDTGDSSSDESTITALIILLSVVFAGLLLVSTLVVIRRMKRQQKLREMTLPQYNVAPSSKAHGLTIQTTNANGRSSLLVFSKDGQPMLANPQSPPYSPDNVPEIRITFPDEQDEMGRSKSGRVVVVRVGERSIGMEPVSETEEQLPAYEKEGQFYSINIDSIGGLKEKGDQSSFH
ncbi:hypothetical protein CMQ_4871 [Grosmannia clavigera kw1407]|uniref:Uncharacterized protein n=1 Tax=Grosmannia clavigera (strain kw1407 / UAMH 11150) TaxID=655863 RepID=F0XUA5_GROCL|nr:uncharacterized protein CMQ_4871 [Grosmannia clavigera kw1407]EFW99019.1 hypothetical protein CMQ_4871 [Grosmannia clavigera kw1407]